MIEENLIAPVQLNVTKPKKKISKKKKQEKSPFKLSDNFNIKAAKPKANLKIKEDSPVSTKREAKTMYGKLAFIFVALTIVLVAVVLYFGFSMVTIVIIPTQEKITDSSTVEIINKAGNTTLAAGQILGVVKQVPVEQTKVFTASGKEILGEEVNGKVTIINNYLKNQPLVATTRLLSSDNKLFRLKNTVNVPAGGRVVAEVYADEAKREMAIGPGKFTIPGLWAGIQDKIYAESQEPMKYFEKVKYIIKQNDLDKAVGELKNELSANAKREVSRAYQEYNQAIFEVDNNSVSQEVQGKVGEEKEKFSIKMKTMVTVVAFNDSDVYEQAKAKLSLALADDKTVVEFNKQDMTYVLDNFNLNQGTATIKVDFGAKVILKDTARVIKKNNLAGLDLEQLKTYLNSLPEVSGYEIKFFPSFIKKVPNLVDRIKIEIKQ
jgi:hypothetical protein